MSDRTRTRERRKQREQERRRNRQFLILGAVVVIAVVGLVLLILANQPADAPIAEETIAQYADVPQSFNESGFPVLGDPESPVQVVEYSSFDCPHCGEFYQDVTPALVERVAAGDISFTYVPLSGTGGIPNGEGAARAALCAGEQDAFWVYHGALFTWQNTFGNQALAGNRLESAVDALGLDTGAWNTCFNSAEVTETLDAAVAAAQAVEGFTGTPTVTVNGVLVSAPSLADINTAIDAVLLG